MICFRDMTFCGSDCANTDCHRHFGEDDSKAAQEWWGEDSEHGAPVAYCDFSKDCPEYKKP